MSAEPLPRGRPRISPKWGPILLFLAPALLLYATFVLLPVVQAVYYSLYKWNGFGALTDFVGLDNYTRALNNEDFINSISHNAFFVALSVGLQIPFSLAVALFLNRAFPGRTVFRLIFFTPYVLSEVITGVLFLLILDPFGPMAALLNNVGIKNVEFLGIDHMLGWTTVMWWVFIVISWKYFGFHMVLLLAGLQGIPHEIEEAALIDGAGRWQAFRHVTLPLLGPTLRVSLFLSIIGAIQLFDMVWIMTRGGPAGETQTMATYMYWNGVQSNEIGYGSAVAVILFLICLAFALLYQRFVLRRDVEGAVTSFSG